MMHLIKPRWLFCLLIGLLMTSCSVLSPVNGPANLYVINTVPPVVVHRSSHPKILMVAQPSASTIYNTTQMVYTKRLYELNYFSKNAWADTPSHMLHGLMVDALRNTHHYRVINASLFSVSADIILNTQLLLIQQDFRMKPSRTRITLRATLIRATTNQIIASQQFSVSAEAPCDTPYGGVIAANQAVNKLLSQLVDFCLKNS